MRLALIGRYAERGILRMLRDEVLVTNGHTVISSWLDGPAYTDAELDEQVALYCCRGNCRDIWLACAIIYQPSPVPSPGRCVDLGIAYAADKPLIVWGVPDWASLPAADRTIYLCGASYAADTAALLRMLEGWGK